MNCPIESRNPEILLAHAAGELDAAMAQSVDLHMAECAACRSMAAGQAALWKALDLWPAPAVSLDFDRRLYHRIDVEMHASWWQRVSRRFRLIPLRQFLPVTAAAGLLLMAGWILREPAKVTAVPRQADTVRAEQVERTLDDMELLHQFSVANSNKGESENAL